MRSLMVWLSCGALAACTASTTLPPAVTCPTPTVDLAPGSCDLVFAQQCSDSNFYEINCQDDSTCTCLQNGSNPTSILASDQTAGFCSGFSVSMVHDLSVKCGWNLNP